MMARKLEAHIELEMDTILIYAHKYEQICAYTICLLLTDLFHWRSNIVAKLGQSGVWNIQKKYVAK